VPPLVELLPGHHAACWVAQAGAGVSAGAP
jgi:hypothetical protein